MMLHTPGYLLAKISFWRDCRRRRELKISASPNSGILSADSKYGHPLQLLAWPSFPPLFPSSLTLLCSFPDMEVHQRIMFVGSLYFNFSEKLELLAADWFALLLKFASFFVFISCSSESCHKPRIWSIFLLLIERYVDSGPQRKANETWLFHFVCKFFKLYIFQTSTIAA